VPSLLQDHPAAISSELSDDALIVAARHDRQAFGCLYDRYLAVVYRYCYGRLGNREDAEDATSQVFARALSAVPTYRGGVVRIWLFTIAHNVVLNIRRDANPTYPLELLPDLADGTLPLDELAAQGERRRSLQRALGQLPDEQRRVLALRLAGLTGPEIAAILGRSHAAVRSTQCRAVAQLRLLLGVPAAGKEARRAR
jgi:RNA polymerase sigma-70 factor (ECF subfamily)